MDFSKKIEKIEKNCIDDAKKELAVLKDENIQNSKDTINKLVEDYQDTLAQKYETELNRIVREFNTSSYNYEMAERLRVTEYKKEVIESIRQKVINEFNSKLDTEEYKNFLFNSISKFKNNINSNSIIVYLTEKDFNRFGSDISTNYGMNVDKMNDDNIGGIKILDKENKVLIDNSIKSNIEDELMKIKL